MAACRYLGTPPSPDDASAALSRSFCADPTVEPCVPYRLQVAMLKITLHDSAGEFRLKLEGRLSGPWVRELELCWKTASSTTQGRKTVVDLGEVDFVDPPGQDLLAVMHAKGVEMEAVTPLICSVLKEICQAPACGTVERKAGSAP